MNKMSAVYVFLLSLPLMSCTVMQMRAENQQMEQTLPVKMQQLGEINNQNQQLTEQKNTLIATLDEKNSSIDDLQTQIDNLEAENSKIKAQTDKQRQKKLALAQSLSQYSAKIKSFKQRKSSRLGESEKIKQIEQLKQEIKEKIKKDSELND